MNDQGRLSRRAVLAAGLALSGVLAVPGVARGAKVLSRTAVGRAEPQLLFRISLAQWSLHRRLFAGELDHLDFPKVTRREFGIEAVEYVNTFFKERSTTPEYVAELKKRCEGEGVRSLLIMCDGEGALGDPDEAKRATAVKNHHRWVDAARALGCHSIRVNAQSAGERDEQARLAADGLRRLTDYAATVGVDVIVENHGGWSSNGAWLAEVIRRVEHPRCGTLPDFGNFRISQTETYDRYQGVAELIGKARGVSAKSYDFDAQGNETTIDYRRMMKVVLDAGYRAYVGIEYEGGRLSEGEGVNATRRLLERLREEMAPMYAEPVEPAPTPRRAPAGTPPG